MSLGKIGGNPFLTPDFDPDAADPSQAHATRETAEPAQIDRPAEDGPAFHMPAVGHSRAAIVQRARLPTSGCFPSINTGAPAGQSAPAPAQTGPKAPSQSTQTAGQSAGQATQSAGQAAQAKAPAAKQPPAGPASGKNSSVSPKT